MFLAKIYELPTKLSVSNLGFPELSSKGVILGDPGATGRDYWPSQCNVDTGGYGW